MIFLFLLKKSKYISCNTSGFSVVEIPKAFSIKPLVCLLFRGGVFFNFNGTRPPPHEYAKPLISDSVTRRAPNYFGNFRYTHRHTRGCFIPLISCYNTTAAAAFCLPARNELWAFGNMQRDLSVISILSSFYNTSLLPFTCGKYKPLSAGLQQRDVIGGGGVSKFA